MSENVVGDEPYLLVEEVAERLGLPLSVLLHRVEAGDIPSRRVETEDGTHYALRLGDLGIEVDDEGMRASVIGGGDESTLSATFGPPSAAPGGSGMVFEPGDSAGVERAIVSAFNSGPQPVPGAWRHAVEGGDQPSRDAATDEAQEAHEDRDGGAEPASNLQSQDATEPTWAVRPREPQQPPPWIIQGPSQLDEPEQATAGEAVTEVMEGVTAEDAGEGEDDSVPPPIHAADAPADEEPDEETVMAELAVPPPSSRPLGLLDTGAQTPRGDLASMSLDARELVAGLLDRWERTLEQRIYTEQRQRFQAELVARQNTVKQLQMELHTARAEHAAAQAEKDRVLASKERELADRERDLAESKRQAEEAQRLLAPARRRRWFRGRDD